MQPGHHALIFAVTLAACAPKPALPSRAAGRVQSIEAGNRVFTTQWGPTKFNAGAHPFGYDDCGPTASLIALAAIGKLDAPTPGGAEDAITKVRDLERGHPTQESGPTFYPMLVEGLARAGAKTSPVDPKSAAIRDRAAGGAVVIVAGDPGEAWGKAASVKGEYLHVYGKVLEKDRFDHWIVVMGIDARGDLLVADPLSSAGVLAVSDEQLDRYIADAQKGRAALAVE